jgi:DNA polymerase
MNRFDLGIDFETHYSSEYSLRKMQNAEYVLDDRFEVIGFSLKLPGSDTRWVSGDFKFQQEFLSKIPWHRVRVIAHNARFDGSILEWRFGFKPASYLCTMVASRPHFVPYTGSMSLEKISEYLDLPPKGHTVHHMLGKHRDDLTSQELAEYGEYCKRDTDNAWAIAQELFKILPEDELTLIDLTLKKYLRPKLKLDGKKIVARIGELHQERAALAGKIQTQYGVTQKMLASRNQFAQVLKFYGVDPPVKPSAADPTHTTFAFAKNDPEFKELLMHSSPEVRELSQARLVFSSSQEASRLDRLLSLHNVKNSWLPCPLIYYGAHTGRFSGDENINLQNLQRGSAIRSVIVAPPGYTLIAADLAQIEARIAACLAGQDDLTQAFRDGRDVYCEFGSEIYERNITKADKRERQVAKVACLALNYGMGYKRFLATVHQNNIAMEKSEAIRIVDLYRGRYCDITALWMVMQSLASTNMIPRARIYPWECLVFTHQRIILPNNMPIIYPDLAMDYRQGLYFRSRKYQAITDPLTHQNGSRLWGGTILENVCQALARIIVTTAELKLSKLGLPASLQVHDELVFVVPEQVLPQAKKVIQQVMETPVEWMPKLPINVEIKSGPDYGSCK